MRSSSPKASHEKDLPAAPRVGTGSLRRQHQAQAAFPAWVIGGLRGNVDTRLRKVDSGELDAVILAAAGLNRLGHGDAHHAPLLPGRDGPRRGSGRHRHRDAARPCAWCSPSCPRCRTRGPAREIDAERRFLVGLGGSCTTPLGIHAEIEGDRVVLRGFLSSVDGSAQIRDRRGGPRRRRARARRRAPRPLLEWRGGGTAARRLPSARGVAMVGLRGRRILITRARAQGESSHRPSRNRAGRWCGFPPSRPPRLPSMTRHETSSTTWTASAGWPSRARTR